MGLYIKNLKISEHCMDCPFMVSRDNDDCILQSAEANENFENWEQMKAGCPLTEVPEPHGELIDEAKLWVEINKICDRRDAGIITDLTCLQQILSAVRHAPAVIPASREASA